MGSKERIARLKKELRNDILCAALAILRKEGRKSLSLRRIASRMGYSAPALYAYFKNKEALLTALCEICYQYFNRCIEKNCRQLTNPKERLIGIITTCWNFAINEREMYNLMWELGNTFANPFEQFKDLARFLDFLNGTLKNLCLNKLSTEKHLLPKSQLVIGVIHGHICLNCWLSVVDSDQRSSLLEDTVLHVLDLVNDYHSR